MISLDLGILNLKAFFTFNRIVTIKKKSNNSSGGEDVEKSELSYPTGRNIKECSQFAILSGSFSNDFTQNYQVTQ